MVENPLRRYLRLKQRNWQQRPSAVDPAVVQPLSKMIDFFIKIMVGPAGPVSRWLEDYRCQAGKFSAYHDQGLDCLRTLCSFLLEEVTIFRFHRKMSLLDEPRRLPRPLSDDQVHRLEKHLLSARSEARTDLQKELAERDLACFYLLWHCGLRISEVCSLRLDELDLEGRKLFIRNSKKGKDRVVYMSDTTAMGLRSN
jgi:site-specific recombinase XerD